MSASCRAWVSGALGLLALLYSAGCARSFSKSSLSFDEQSEALSRFSFGLLAEISGDSPTALRELETAIRLDPGEEALYEPAIAVALKLKQPDDALRLARQIREKQPQTLDPVLMLAHVCALTEHHAEAESLFRQAISNFPDQPAPRLNFALFFLSQNRIPEAIETLDSAVDEQVENIEILQLLGALSLEQAGELSDPAETRLSLLKGIRLLEKAMELDNSDPRRWQQIGYAYLSIKEAEQALNALKKARIKMPENLMLAREVMELAIQTGDYEYALDLFEELPAQTRQEPMLWLQHLAKKTPPEQRGRLRAYVEEKLQKKNPPAFLYAQLISFYLEEERYADAKEALLKALVVNPADNRLRTVLGYLYLQEENYPEAYAEFGQIRNSSPESEWAKNPFFAFNFMVAAQKSGHLEEAVATLASTYTNEPVVLDQYIHSLLSGTSPVSARAAIDLLESFRRLSPDAIEALYYMALLQAEEKEYAAALETARQFEGLATAQGKPHLLDGFFYYRYAALQEQTGDLEEAEKLFYKAIETGDAETAASSQNYIAYMWAERGEKLDLGLTLVEKALLADPENAAYIDTLGWIYYMQGRYKEALVQLKTASELLSDDPCIWEHLGDTYLKLENRPAAREYWQKALELSPHAEHLHERMKENEPKTRDTGNGKEPTENH